MLAAKMTTAAPLLLCATAPGQDCLLWGPVPQGSRFGQDAAMCFDSRRGVSVLFGGAVDWSNAGNETWEWDGAWTQRSPGVSPESRRSHALAFDWARGVCVLFGGSTQGTIYADTWEYDGQRWGRRATTGPSPRFEHAMAYDERRGEAVLFGGGQGYPVVFADTWVWDGAQWQQRAGPGPSARYEHAMAYDASREVVVLFGGLGPLGGPLTDTWEWDGRRWEHRTDIGPEPLTRAEVYYDSAHRRVRALWRRQWVDGLMGVSEWDGSRWSFVTEVGPPARRDYALAYDSRRRSAVLYGGTNGWFPSTDGYFSFASTLAFLRGPVSQRVEPGATLRLRVEACGTGLDSQWYHSGRPLRDDGRITGARTPALRVESFGPGDAGDYYAVITSAGGSVASPSARVEVSTLEPCYPDCDTSTGARVLDVFDFLCFQNAFAAGSSYACDCDTGQFTICDIFDFLCFFDAFSRGCP